MKQEVVSETKRCPKCNEDVLKSNFSKNINSSDNLQVYCKPCAYRLNSADAENKRKERLAAAETEGEIWKSLEGYSKYEFSSHGRIRNLFSKEILKGMKKENGFCRVTLTNDEGAKIQIGVHEIIARAFLDPGDKKNVRHIDNDGSNNNIENLQWSDKRRR